jgi:hypothetical protein
MARDRNSSPAYGQGRDASYRPPSFIPDDSLLPRDDSGGLNFERHTGEFGDGGYVFGGEKSYLSASGMNGNMSDDDGENNDGNNTKRGKSAYND